MKVFVRQCLATGAGVALAMGGGAVVLAQSQSNSPQPEATPGQTQAAPAPTQNPAGSTATSGQTAQPQQKLQMVRAQAELKTSLDAKKAKQGETVTAKLVENVQIPNAQELPKNTVLEGHVDQVTPSENKGDSTMVVTFDKAKLKNGQELPIKATVLGLSEPALAADQAGGGMPAGGAMPAGGGAPAGAGAPAGSMAGAGGGSSAGMASSRSESQPAMNPGATNSGTEQAQNAQPSGGVPDVQLSSSIHQHASATLTSKGRNVHVPDGTELQVAITVVPAGVRVP